MARGAPTKYDPNKNKTVIDLMSEGASIVEVADLLGVTRKTVYNWADENHDSYQKDFAETIRIGLTKSQAWWERNGRENLENTKFSYTGWIMNMTNRFREDWKNKQSVEHSSNEDKPLQFQQIVIKK